MIGEQSRNAIEEVYTLIKRCEVLTEQEERNYNSMMGIKKIVYTQKELENFEKKRMSAFRFFMAGKDAKYVAEKVGCTKNMAYVYKSQFHKKYGRPEKPIDKLKELIESGLQMSEICKEYGFTKGQVYSARYRINKA